MYCGSLFVWDGGRTIEGPPTFVAGNCVPRQGAWWGMKQIPPCSLRSLVGMTRMLGLCAGVVCWTVECCDYERESKSHPVAKCATKGGATFEFGFELLGTELRDGVKPFCGGYRLNRAGV
jgi:hypothetical protein